MSLPIVEAFTHLHIQLWHAVGKQLVFSITAV